MRKKNKKKKFASILIASFLIIGVLGESSISVNAGICQHSSTETFEYEVLDDMILSRELCQKIFRGEMTRCLYCKKNLKNHMIRVTPILNCITED